MTQGERAEFLYQARTQGLSLSQARTFLRLGATLARLAVAECNGDYPYQPGGDNWRNPWPTSECAECGMLWATASMSKAGVCPQCRTVARVKALVAYVSSPKDGALWSAECHGDPRGAVLTIKAPSGRELVAG